MKRNKKRFSLHSMQKIVLTGVCSFAFWGIFLAVETLTTVRMPTAEFPAEFYSNQTHDDLRLVFSRAIEEAKESVALNIYALTDLHIIQALRKKAEEGIPVKVIHDSKASYYGVRKLGSQVQKHQRHSRGLMHQKILVIDKEQTWIGSANMTTASLRKHGNLVIAMKSHAIARRVLDKMDGMTRPQENLPFLHRSYRLGQQPMELWFLPDDPGAVDRVKGLIRSAQKTLRVAMFTWTRRDFAQEVIAAWQRGVKVELVIDRSAGKGAGAGVVEMLKKAGVPLSLSRGDALLHHKMAIIDDRILINGSANWTKAAFTQNDDCFIILHELTAKQQRSLSQLWKVISLEAI